MKYVFLLSVLLLTSCATWIPAAAHKQDDRSYLLSTTGNSFASIEKMKIKLEKKANSICEEYGFEYIKKPNVTFGKQKDYSTGTTSSYKSVSTTIKCLVES